MRKLELECYNCGLSRKISYSTAIWSLIKKGEISFPCNLCCYNNHYKFSFQFFNVLKHMRKMRGLRKKIKR